MIYSDKTPFASVICIVISTFFTDISAQQSLHITGKVLDDESKAPLGFASVRVMGKPLSTVTNEDGAFDFKIPAEYSEDTLMISVMGYAPYRQLVNDIKGIRDLVVRLKLRPIMLSEVVVKDTILDARDIVARAYENIGDNYPVVPYYYDAFYRETHQENNRNVMLVEAALNIYDNGYKPVHGKWPRVRELISLKNVRASRNYRHSLFKNTVVERYNLVISALRWNKVKYRERNIKEMLRDNEFILDSVVYLNNSPVYVVSFFSYIPKYPLFERKNTLYIDAKNFSICKYGWEEYSKQGKYSETPWFLNGDSTYLVCRKRISTIYEYENYNGKMFFKYFDEKCYEDIYNVNGDSVEFEALGHTTIIVTGIETGKVKAKNTGLMKRDRSLHAQATPYDSTFWHSYGQLVPLTKKQISDLEIETPLEEQFKMWPK